MHHDICGVAIVDHRDCASPIGNLATHKLNNRRSNLRSATTQQNARNRKVRSDNKSGYKGVSKRRTTFAATISIDKGKRLHLGTFRSAEDAARAYDSAAQKYFGEFARVNFPS